MPELTNIPYCGLPPVPGELWLRWNLDPVLMLVLAVLVYLHARRMGPLRGSGRGLWFAGGWAAVTLGLISPICALSVSLFSVRVTQHMWLIFVAAPMLVLACQGRGESRVSPLLGTALFAITLWLWHVPDMYSLTFTSDLAYWSMHVSLTGSALLLWDALLRGPLDRALARLGAGFFSLMHMTLLGALITLSGRLLYAPHILTAQAWGLSPLEDQQLGGLIMWVPAGVVMVVGCLAVVRTLLRSSDAVGARSA